MFQALCEALDLNQSAVRKGSSHFTDELTKASEVESWSQWPTASSQVSQLQSLLSPLSPGIP